jgi:hypothetical protein
MIRQKNRKKNSWFPVTRPTLILTPNPMKFFSVFHTHTKNNNKKQTNKQTKTRKKCQHRKEIKTITSYQSTISVRDIFHDIQLPVDKTSIVTAREATVVSGPAVSKNQIKIK